MEIILRLGIVETVVIDAFSYIMLSCFSHDSNIWAVFHVGLV